MPLFDLPLADLQRYQPDVAEPADFDTFWQRTLDQTRAAAVDANFVPMDSPLQTLDVFDVFFSGYGGQTVRGWFLLPKQRSGKLPCIVEYKGYSGGRGFPIDNLLWASLGYAHLVMDTRGQGWWRTPGATADIPVDGANPHVPGFMTQGILDPDSYYYRRVFADAVRAVDVARRHPAVDADKVIITGRSQGGGITLAVAGLVDNLLAAMPDVPFLCHYARATDITSAAPYSEIVEYCQQWRDQTETVFNTLSYFDGVNFAKRATAPTFFSVALMDDICPPSTVYAAYNHYAAAKQIEVWKYNNHEGGGQHHVMRQIAFLEALLSAG